MVKKNKFSKKFFETKLINMENQINIFKAPQNRSHKLNILIQKSFEDMKSTIKKIIKDKEED